MDRFLDIYKLPKLSQEDRENLNKPITRTKMNSVILF